jgi:hypothetical protein
MYHTRYFFTFVPVEQILGKVQSLIEVFWNCGGAEHLFGASNF